MAVHDHVTKPSRWLVLPALAAIGTSAAYAAEYCVTCEAPAAMYACAIEGAAADAPPDPRMQLLCISELAKAGGHENCSVPRSAPQPCPGVMKIVTATAGTVPAPNAVEVAPAAAPEPENASEHAKSKEAEPKTIEDLAKKTVEASKKGLETAGEAIKDTTEKAGEQAGKAGNSIGDAAKKTWDCMKSLFSDC